MNRLVCTVLLLPGVVSAAETTLPAVSYSHNIGQTLIGLLVIIVLIFAVVWLLKRTGAAGLHNTNAMRIKACLPLSAKEKLFLVEVGTQQLVIGVAPGCINNLYTLAHPIDQSITPATATTSFAEKLKAMLNNTSTQ